MKIALKVFEDSGTGPQTLFHGWKGSRTLLLDTILKAEKKEVRDGSSVTYYESVWHVFPNPDEVIKWSRSCKKIDGRCVCFVNLNDKIRPKKHSRGNIQLTNKISISRENWEVRIPLRKFITLYEMLFPFQKQVLNELYQ